MNVYVTGPSEERNSQFVSKHFGELQTAPNIKTTTEKILPNEDTYFIYVILNNNDDWLQFYTEHANERIILVKGF